MTSWRHSAKAAARSSIRTAPAEHLVRGGPDPDAFIDQMTHALADKHGIANITLQQERRPRERAAT